MTVLLACATTLTMGLPPSVAVQGLLRGDGGAPVDGSYQVLLSLYEGEEGGAAVWKDTFEDVAVSGGVLSLVLDGVDASVIGESAALWMGVKIEGEPELVRQRVLPVPMAHVAALAFGLKCEGCVTTQHIAADAIASASLANASIGPEKLVEAYVKRGGDQMSGTLAIVSGGRLGIGVGNPSAPIHVAGTNDDGIALIAEGASGRRILVRPDQDGAGQIAATLSGATGTALALATQDAAGAITERVRVDEAGRLGVGTSSPKAHLEVSGSDTALRVVSLSPAVSARLFAGSSGGLTRSVLASDGMLAFGAGPGTQMTIEADGDVQIAPGYVGDGGAKLRVRGTTNDDKAAALRVESADATARLVVRNDGRVGVGTTSPLAPLDVAGAVRAELFGRVIATGTLVSGESVSININGLSTAGGNLGIVSLFLGAATDGWSTTDNAWVVAVHAHGQGYNSYHPIASRGEGAAGYSVSLGSISTFSNTSATTARYIITQLPLLLNRSDMLQQ